MITPIENEMTLFELTFENGSHINPEDAQIKYLLKLLEETTKENEQKKYIKQIVDVYKSSTEQETKNLQAKNILLEFFTKYGSKKVLKKYLQDVIGEPNLSTSLLKSTTDEILENINNRKCCNIKQCNDLVNFVYLMQSTPNFQYEITIEYLFPLYCVLFEGFVYHATSNFQSLTLCEELFTLMNAVLKQILFGLVKIIPYSEIISKEYSVKLIFLSHSILASEKIGFDLKTKSGLIITYSFNNIPENYRKKFKYKECASLELIADYNDENFFVLTNYKLSVFKQSESIVIIYSSILSVLPQEKLLKIQIDGKTLICILYSGLMECAKRKTCVPHVIVEISRTLSIIGKHLTAVPPELVKPLFLEAIAYIWSHIDHFVDTVRSYAKQFFADIVMVSAYHKNNGYADLAEILIEYVKQLSSTQTIRFLAMEYIAQYLTASYLLNKFEDLQETLLTGISEPTISDQVCKTYISIMEKHFQEAEKDEWIKFWIVPVTRVLKSCNKCTIVCQRIMTRAFQLHPVILRIVYPTDYVGNSQESGVLLKCLQYARLNGIELTVDRKENSCLYWRGLIDKDRLMKFSVHQDDEIRISVLAVIVDSQKSTEIFLDWELEYLLTYLHYNVTSQIPNVRKQIATLYKKALTRYSTGFYVIMRNIAYLTKRIEMTKDPQEPVRIRRVYQELNASYRCFIRKFTKLLISYLTFDSNYFRRSTSLDLLISVQKFLHNDQWQSCWSEDDVKNCHNILFDGYESNKRMAVTLLKHLPPASIGFTNLDFTFKYMHRCLNMAVDLKPSKTLSAAYLLEVCTYSPHFFEIVQYAANEGHRQVHDTKLDMIVVLIGKLCTQDVKIDDIYEIKTALYGLLLSIKHILENRDLSKNNEAYCGVFEHITLICDNLSHSIMPIVCSPAPEGYIPDSGEELCDKDESTKAQKILCYAWRTIKEMTLLLAEIVRQTVALEGKTTMLAEVLLIKIGALFFKIFVESRHRGVFEKAYVGFSVICESFWTSASPNINHLPKTWLRDAVAYCTGAKQTDKLCATRRSAGLPFLLLAILSTEPAFDKPSFHGTMKTLLKTCADTPNNEHKMHCMNVLRIIFRHSKLGEAVSSYVAAAVIVVINCFKSKCWGVRNSATLLFASLMTRIFGVQRTQDSEDLCIKNRLTVRVFFLRYPELFQFLLRTLSEECGKRSSLVLHPLLMILARLYPSHIEEYNTQMEKYLPHITTALSNPFFRTRDLAARASVPLIRTDRISDYLVNLFSEIKSSDIKNNECQGLLLQIWHILKSNNNLEVPLTKCLRDSIHLLQYAGKKFSHMTISLYLEVVLLLLMKFRHYDDVDTLKDILTLLSRQITSNLLPLTATGKYPQMRMLVVLFIVVNKYEECEVTYSTVTNQIMSQLYGHDMEMKRFCLNLLIYMNQVQNETTSKHPLFQTEELQIPQEIINLVDSFERHSVKKILTHIHPYLKCFLTEEIKFQHYIKKVDQVLLFLLLNYYPCVIKYLNLSKQETLNMLINFCSCDNEELISAVVSCMSTFLLQLDYNVLGYGQLIQVLVESASPAASDFRRLAVCDFLSKNYILYCNEEPILNGDELQMVLNIVMVLLEDDELAVRNAMSNFASALKIKITLNKNAKQTLSGHRWPVLPERAREDLFNLCYLTLPKDRAICFIFSWACRHFPDTSNDASEVFERGEVNLYAENVPFMNLCVCLLHKLLWPLEDDLSYEDKSIFIEEHTLIVTTVLLDSLMKYPSPMMLYKTKLSVICALKSTVKFLERYEINDNFVNEFRVYLDDTILGYLTKQVEHSDLFSVRKIIKRIYEPVLSYKKN